MDQAIPVIPISGTHYGYARPEGCENPPHPKYLDRSDCGNDPLEASQSSHQAGWDLREGL